MHLQLLLYLLHPGHCTNAMHQMVEFAFENVTLEHDLAVIRMHLDRMRMTDETAQARPDALNEYVIVGPMRSKSVENLTPGSSGSVGGIPSGFIEQPGKIVPRPHRSVSCQRSAALATIRIRKVHYGGPGGQTGQCVSNSDHDAWLPFLQSTHHGKCYRFSGVDRPSKAYRCGVFSDLVACRGDSNFEISELPLDLSVPSPALLRPLQPFSFRRTTHDSRKHRFQILHNRFNFLFRRRAAQAEPDRSHAGLRRYAHSLQDR